MGVNFNGNVTINGDLEIFDNGSVKITGNEISVSIDNLSQFIEDNLKYSPNKAEYLKSAHILKDSEDKGLIINAILKLKEMKTELGKGFWISGLSQIAIETIKSFVK